MVVPTYDVIEQLVSPARSTLLFEFWTPLEIAIFEAGLCQFGKRFDILT